MNKILDKIKKGKIRMRPKSYFIFKTILYVLGFVFSFLFSIFLISFIIFSLRASGAWYFPSFGFRGLGLFFVSFPWLLLLLGIIFLVVLEVFAKRFSLVYKKPLLYSVLGILIIVLLISIFIARTSMHTKIFKDKIFMKMPDNAFIGSVLNINDHGYEIKTKKGDILQVITEIPFEKGDWIMIIGEKDDSVIKAFKVRKINDFPKGGQIRRYTK